ncbi:MAG: 3-deoxy-D-manno-octulosonic acid transferase [Pseudomonadaceae bacterium]|nr:3-deoxy-D-manno-octulosonic acid transferase [Pseudomonadaceae bacterium]
MSLLLYRLAQVLLSPLLVLLMAYRLLVGREDSARFAERRGKSDVARPAGPLVWLHGASVGEVVSLLPVLHQLRALRPDVHLLLTTGTRTGMRMLEKTAPALAGHGAVVCRYVPLDVGLFVRRFVNHWQPNLSVFVESEFWPELLAAAPNPMLLNGRISDRSWPQYQKWAWFFRPRLARYLHVIAQRDDDAKRLRHLGASNITVGGNLKFDAAPLAADEALLEKFRALIGSRPTVVVASTHPGEEEMAAKLHMALKQQVPEVLTIIVPRHPHRGTAAMNALQRYTRAVHRRGTGEVPHSGGQRHTDIYLADTLGELGLWYRLADVAIVGGSLVPHGGHNPLEPLRLGVPTATGPHMFNFQDMMPPLTNHQLVFIAPDMAALTQHVLGLLTKPELAKAARSKIATTLPLLSGSSKTAALAIAEKLPLAETVSIA